MHFFYWKESYLVQTGDRSCVASLPLGNSFPHIWGSGRCTLGFDIWSRDCIHGNPTTDSNDPSVRLLELKLKRRNKLLLEFLEKILEAISPYIQLLYSERKKNLRNRDVLIFKLTHFTLRKSFVGYG